MVYIISNSILLCLRQQRVSTKQWVKNNGKDNTRRLQDIYKFTIKKARKVFLEAWSALAIQGRLYLMTAHKEATCVALASCVTPSSDWAILCINVECWRKGLEENRPIFFMLFDT